ncbi:MAG: helix-turn-helix transcriptional regulator, partial [Dehalococcoidia bacterium]
VRPTRPTPFVGRERETRILVEALASVRSGTGGAVLVAGEAGIGKSRLIAELRRRAETDGFAVLQGACFEPDRSAPYAPFADLLRTALHERETDATDGSLRSFAPELVTLLPEHVTDAAPSAPTPTGDPEQDKRRLFAAITTAFVSMAGGRPLLVCIEDLHWSDDTSLELVAYLVRRLSTHPVLLMLTYRSDETRPALLHLLAELERSRRAEEIALVPFEVAEVELMLRRLLAHEQPVRAEFLHAICSLTDGNPFFIEEVVKSLVADGDVDIDGRAWDRHPLGEVRIPRTVQDAVQRQMMHLSAAARRLLALAAVAGRRFDFPLLQALTGHTEAALLAEMRELIAAQLVVEESADRFAFRHALTHEAIVSQLLTRERRAIHAEIAEAIEMVYAGSLDAHLEDLALHWHEGGAGPEAMEYSRRAGERAQAMYAPREAAAHFTRALDAARTLGGTPPAALLRARGAAHETLGEFDAARVDHEAALDAAAAAGDRRAEWQSLLDLGYLWASRDYRRTGDYFQRALQRARTIGDPVAIAQSLNRLGNWLVNNERPRESLQYHHEALAIFEGQQDQRGIAGTLDLLGLATQEAGDLIASGEHYTRAIDLFRRLNDRPGLSSALALYSLRAGAGPAETVAASGPSLAQSEAITAESLAIAQAIGWRAGEAYSRITLSISLLAQGKYGQALSMLRLALAVAEEIEHHLWLALAHWTFGALYFDLLLLPAAREHLEEGFRLAGEVNAPMFPRNVGSTLSLLRLAEGDPAGAASVLDRALGPNAGMDTVAARLCWRARGEVVLTGSDASRALDIAEQLIATAPNSNGAVIPHIEQLRGRALAALHRHDDAERSLLAARAAAEAQGLRPAAWRIDVALGDLYRVSGRRADAQDADDSARIMIDTLAVDVPEEPVDGLRGVTLREHFRQSALMLLPQRRPATPLRAAKQAHDGLTARERDVAALVARGRSNREIAETLVLGERTIETHISNIFAKLGYTSRAQIAAWAVEKGFFKDAE